MADPPLLVIPSENMLAPHLPVHEAARVHHGGLDDLPAWEDPPGDRVGLHVLGVGQVMALGWGTSGRGISLLDSESENGEGFFAVLQVLKRTGTFHVQLIDWWWWWGGC